MSISSPFAKSQNSNLSNNNSNNSPQQNTNNSSHPPNISSISKTKEPPKQNSQYSTSTPSSSISPQPLHSNFLNNDDISEEEFSKMKLEYDTKIRPFNSSSEYISTTSSI